ncbi:MAG: Gfo/Idh/MocA family oxidoreductase [Bacteroidota bacterium]
MECYPSISRRTAMQQLALGVGSLSLLPAWSREKPRMGVALVGLGNYANLALAPALLETKYCRLTGLVSGDRAKAEAWAKTYEVPFSNLYSYETFDQIADNEEIDIVYVVLPNAMHAEYSIRAAEAGKHVICEKPMAISSEECAAMIAACKKAGTRLSIGYRLHFEPHHREVMRLGQQQVFGPLHLIETSFGYRFRNLSSWRLDPVLGGGGAIMDLGVYCIQAARYVSGQEPISVQAQAFTYDREVFQGIHESLTWQFEFSGDVMAHTFTSYSTYVDRLYGSAEKGWFECNPAFNGAGSQGRTQDGPMDFPKVNQQALQMDEFVRAIREDRPSPVSGEEGGKDLKLVEAIVEAAESGRKIAL